MKYVVPMKQTYAGERAYYFLCIGVLCVLCDHLDILVSGSYAISKKGPKTAWQLHPSRATFINDALM